MEEVVERKEGTPAGAVARLFADLLYTEELQGQLQSVFEDALTTACFTCGERLCGRHANETNVAMLRVLLLDALQQNLTAAEQPSRGHRQTPAGAVPPLAFWGDGAP